VLVGGGGFSVVVVVATVVVMGSGGVVTAVTTGVRSCSVGDVGAVDALVSGVTRAERNLPSNDEFTDAAPGFFGVVVVVGFGGLDATVVVDVAEAEAEAVLGAATFVAGGGLGAPTDGNESLCTKPT
jgi:hypothetical protein